MTDMESVLAMSHCTLFLMSLGTIGRSLVGYESEEEGHATEQTEDACDVLIERSPDPEDV